MFHRFCTEPTGNPGRVDRATLDRQTRYLARHHTSWTPDQHLEAVQGRPWPGGRCPVVVTVDDGYRDFAEIAFPVFRDRGIPVMFFVTTGFVDGSTWFWWDQIEYVLDRAKVHAWEYDLGSGAETFDLRSDRGRARAWDRVTDHGRLLPDEDKRRLVDSVADSLDVVVPAEPPAEYAAVGWDDLARMIEEGLLVGAHTRTHVILSQESEERAREEIHGSRADLERRLQRSVTWFCYPQGQAIDYDQTVRDMVAKGFRGCYVAYQTPPDPEDPMTLPRYGASSDLIQFRWSMCGAEYLARRLRQFLGVDPARGDSGATNRAPTPRAGRPRETTPVEPSEESS
jgi:peptidoglycan/xylan/chitin deacetylase (PgdA/CDA1 family)